MKRMVKYVLCFAVALQVCQSKNHRFKVFVFVKPRLLLPGRLIARYEYMRNCEDVPNLPLRLVKQAEITEIGTGQNYVINADVVNEEVVPKIDEMVVRIKRCDDALLVTCQAFQTWRFKQNVCGLVEMKGQLWSPIVNNTTPHLKCPVETGYYFIRNGFVDITIISGFPVPDVDKYFWRVRTEGYHPKLFACLEGGVRFFRIHT